MGRMALCLVATGWLLLLDCCGSVSGCSGSVAMGWLRLVGCCRSVNVGQSLWVSRCGSVTLSPIWFGRCGLVDVDELGRTEKKLACQESGAKEVAYS